MQIRLLGPVEVWSDGVPLDAGTTRQRCVLAALAVDAGRPVLVDTIVDRVWGEAPPLRARETIQVYLTRLRKVLVAAGSGAIVRRSNGYLLDVDPASVDIYRFRRLSAEARAPGCPPTSRLALLREAVDLWHGEPVADLTGDWPQALRQHWRQEHLETLDDWAGAEVAAGNPNAPVRHLSALIDQYPLAESLLAALLRALQAAGRSAEALDRYDRARKRLAEQLGTDPSPELQDVYRSILTGAARVTPHSPPPDAAEPDRTARTGQAAATARTDLTTAHLDVLRQRSPTAAVTPRAPVPAHLPPPVGGFVGRSDVLDRLEAIRADPDTPVVVISGTAGVGKTTLAVRWAHRAADRFPDGQLYVNLRGFDPAATPLDPADVVRGFLDALGVEPERVPDPLQERIGLYRTLVYGRRMLVVLDNARDADQVSPLFPGDPAIMTVVTSRNRLTRLAANVGADQIVLDVLSQAVAGELLTRRVGTRRAAAEPAAVREITDLCARLPLAIAIVGAYAAGRPEFPLSAVATNLAAARDTAPSVDPTPDNPSGTGDIEIVIASSYRALPPRTARLFRLLGVHPGPDIDAHAAASLLGVPPTEIGAPLAELVEAHLLSERQPGRYAFHDLLRAYAATLARAEGGSAEEADALLRVTDHYLRSLELADHLMSPLARRVRLPPPVADVTPVEVADRTAAAEWVTVERRALTALIRRAAAAQLDVHVWQLAWLLWRFFEFRGYLTDWVATQELALESARRLADPVALEHVNRALAFAWTRLDKYDRARAHLTEAAAQHDHLDDPRGRARVLLSMAWVEGRADRPQDSLRWAEQALAMFDEMEDRLGMSQVLSNMAWNLRKTGDLDRAFDLCTRGLELNRDLGDTYCRADLLDTMGEIYHQWGDHFTAVKCLDEGAQLHRELGDRYAEGVSLQNLGDAYAAADEHTQAQTAWRTALDIFADLGHSDAATVRAKLTTADETPP